MVTTWNVLSLYPAITLREMLMQHPACAPSLPRNARAILALCEFYKLKLEVLSDRLAGWDNEKDH